MEKFRAKAVDFGDKWRDSPRSAAPMDVKLFAKSGQANKPRLPGFYNLQQILF